MLYLLIGQDGKQRSFHVEAAAKLFQTLYGGEIHVVNTARGDK